MLFPFPTYVISILWLIIFIGLIIYHIKFKKGGDSN